MWKKLTDLLFEEDESNEEVEENIEVQPKQKEVSLPRVEVKREESKPLVTKALNEEKKEVKPTKSSINIVVDDLKEKNLEKEPVKQEKRQQREAVRPRPIQPVKQETKPTYDFTPVISPMFGLSEKDAQQPVAPVITTKKKPVNNSEIGTVISPMYGVDRDSEPDVILGNLQSESKNIDDIEAEQEVENFSLDEILAKRFPSEDNEKTKFFTSNDLNQEELDKTVVINKHNMSLFDDEE